MKMQCNILHTGIRAKHQNEKTQSKGQLHGRTSKETQREGGEAGYVNAAAGKHRERKGRLDM